MQITLHQTDKGFTIQVLGYELPPRFTLATGRPAMERLLEVCKPHAEKLLQLAAAREEKILWNRAANGQGRNWPEFSAWEKFFSKLQKEAGIKDS